MPFIHPHLALMPDAHLGKGATVGSVIATDRAIMPAAVGVDTGCGMVAVRTQWTEDELRAAGELSKLRKAVEGAIPLSAGKFNRVLTDSAIERTEDLIDLWYDMTDHELDGPEQYAKNWKLQLGTLGSGNHFIEITVDEEQRVWAFLHSGHAASATRSHSITSRSPKT